MLIFLTFRRLLCSLHYALLLVFMVCIIRFCTYVYTPTSIHSSTTSDTLVPKLYTLLCSMIVKKCRLCKLIKTNKTLQPTTT